VNRAFTGPLALSVAGHCAALLLLLAFAGHLPRLPPPPQPRAIQIMLAPLVPPVPAVKEAPSPSPPPPIVNEKPPPPPPVVEEKPPPHVAKEPPPRPRARPVTRRRPPPEVRREPPVREMYREPPPIPYQPPVEYAPPPRTAAIPRPPPAAPRPSGPVVSAGYRGMLSAWIERHKFYPREARERGEAGAGVLRFRVDRSGRLLNYAVVRSTGYPDLDAAIDRMMQGAQLPPFPADMTASDIEVSVTIRFALAR
jgi:periplasmic protein TonB